MRYLVSGEVEKYNTFFDSNGFRKSFILIKDVCVDGVRIDGKVQMPVGKWCRELAPGNYITFNASLDLNEKILQPKRPYLQSRSC